MQEVLELITGGALKITIEEFKTPNGNIINKKGITPDIEVEALEDEERDVQLEKAIEILKYMVNNILYVFFELKFF